MGKGFWIGLAIAIISFALAGVLAVSISIGFITKGNAFIWLVLLGVVFLVGIGILIWSLVFKKHEEVSIVRNIKNQTKQKQPVITEPSSDNLRDSLISARERAEALLEIGKDADIVNVRPTLKESYDRYEIAFKYLKQEHQSNPEYMSLRDPLRTGQARLSTLLRGKRNLSKCKSKLDDNSKEIISKINNILASVSTQTNIEQVKSRGVIQVEIGCLIIEGTDVLNGFKSVHVFGDVWPIDEFQSWRGKVSQFLSSNQELKDQYALWFKDVGIDVADALLANYIQACEAGLNRLEKILGYLRE